MNEKKNAWNEKRKNECMHEWMNECIRMHECIRMFECMNAWMHEWMNEWMNEWKTKWKMNEWMNDWMNEWMNECVDCTPCNAFSSHMCPELPKVLN